MHAQLIHAALDFLSRRRRVLGGNGNHADEAVGMTARGSGQDVIGHRGKSHCGVFVHDLHARRCQTDHLHINARFVHVLQPQSIEIGQATHDVLGPLTGAAHVKAHQVLEADIHVVFGQDALVNLQHLRRGKRFFSRNPPVGPGRQRREGVAHGVGTCNLIESAQKRAPYYLHSGTGHSQAGRPATEAT